MGLKSNTDVPALNSQTFQYIHAHQVLKFYFTNGRFAFYLWNAYDTFDLSCYMRKKEK